MSVLSFPSDISGGPGIAVWLQYIALEGLWCRVRCSARCLLQFLVSVPSRGLVSRTTYFILCCQARAAGAAASRYVKIESLFLTHISDGPTHRTKSKISQTLKKTLFKLIKKRFFFFKENLLVLSSLVLPVEARSYRGHWPEPGWCTSLLPGDFSSRPHHSSHLAFRPAQGFHL